MSIKIPFERKKISTLATLSAAIALLLGSLLLPLFNLLPPVQAQTPMTFKTLSPSAQDPEDNLILTFEAHGTNSSGSQKMTGSFEVINEGGVIVYSGNIESGQFTNNNVGASISLNGTADNGGFSIQAGCNNTPANFIEFNIGGDSHKFFGPVECSTQGGGDTTTPEQQSSSTSSMAGTSHDSDSNVSFRTPTAAEGSLCTPDRARLTFDAQGTDSPDVNVIDGTFQITSLDEQILYSGNITSGRFTNDSSGGRLTMEGPLHSVPSGTACATRDQGIAILTSCSTSNTNSIDVINEEAGIYIGDFSGPVECSSQGGDTTTPEQQSSSSMTGSSQDRDSDGDGDGIPDSSDRCTHNSNPRCYKEGDANTTTTHDQQQPSSNRTGNQTRQ
jgi:hypothetical protein